MRQYRNRLGVTQWMPSIEEMQELDREGEGWCLACGSTQPGVEPDARRYECEACGAAKVYGSEELVAMGLIYG